MSLLTRIVLTGLLLAVVETAGPVPTAHAAPVITGTVTDAESGKPLAGITVSDMRMTVMCIPTCIPFPMIVGTTATGADGRYSLDLGSAPAGDSLSFGDPGAQYTSQSVALSAPLPASVDGALPLAATAGTVTVGAPAIAGDPRFGHTLTAQPGSALPADTVLDYQWLADGAPVGTGPTYRLGAGDLGKAMTVKVTGWARGYHRASASSAPTARVSRLTSSIAATARRTKAGTVRLTVVVTADGVVPTGKVAVYRGKRLVKHASLSSGRASLKLRHQPPRRPRYRVVYAGDSGVTGTTTTVRPRR